MYYLIDTKKFATILRENGMGEYQNLNDYISCHIKNRYIIVFYKDNTDYITCTLSLYEGGLKTGFKFYNFKEIFTLEYDSYSITFKRLNDPYIFKSNISADDEKAIDMLYFIHDCLNKSVYTICKTKEEIQQHINKIITDTFLN